jgi:hypothetical protein
MYDATKTGHVVTPSRTKMLREQMLTAGGGPGQHHIADARRALIDGAVRATASDFDSRNPNAQPKQ